MLKKSYALASAVILIIYSVLNIVSEWFRTRQGWRTYWTENRWWIHTFVSRRAIKTKCRWNDRRLRIVTNRWIEDESETDGGNKKDGSETEDPEIEDESNPAEEIDGTEEGDTKTEIETDATETDKRYPDGKFGYVPDVTSVRKRHLELYLD